MGKTDMSYYKDLAIRIVGKSYQRKNWRREDPLLLAPQSLKFLQINLLNQKSLKRKKAAR